MIDFNSTLEAIMSYRNDRPADFSKDDQVSAVMADVCRDAIAGQYTFEENDTDAFSRSFIVWTKENQLLRTA